MCGLDIHVSPAVSGEQRVTLVRGAKNDVWSKGYLCPKGSAVGHLHHDPDRLRAPMVRKGELWREVSWEEAFQRCEELIHPLMEREGPTAFTAFVGTMISPVAYHLKCESSKDKAIQRIHAEQAGGAHAPRGFVL